jgi:hypothetical protein
MLLYDIIYIILTYIDYYNLYFNVIIGYYKLLYPKLLYIILF